MPEARTPRRTPRVSAVSRDVVKTLDRLERRVALVLGGIGAVVSLVSLYIIFFVHPETTVTRLPLHAQCPPGFHVQTRAHLVITLCSAVQRTPASELWLYFALIVLATAFLFYAALQKKRTLAVVTLLFIGLALGPFSLGLPFAGAGVWLMWRAWRLQRYGVATFTGVSQINRQRAADRKAGKPVAPLAAKSAPIIAAPDAPRRASEASKRYTPKKPPRKKR
jgi:hypothetical protein